MSFFRRRYTACTTPYWLAKSGHNRGAPLERSLQQHFIISLFYQALS